MTEKTKQEIIKAQESNFVKGLKKVAESYGYETYYIWVEVSKTGFESLHFEIYPKENDFRTYIPEIYVRNTFGRKTKEMDNPKFKVQTTSYGALNEEEMQKFMDAMNNGFSMQCYLNNLDWSKCPRIKFDNEWVVEQ